MPETGPLGVSLEPLLGTFAADILSFAHCVSAALSPSGLRLLPQPRSVAPGSPLAHLVGAACPPLRVGLRPNASGRGAGGKDAQAGGVLGPRSGLGEAEGPPAPQDLSRSSRSGDKDLAAPVDATAPTRCRRPRVSAGWGHGWPSRRETAARAGSTSWRPCTHPLQEAAAHQPAGAKDGPAGVKRRGRDSNPWTSF